MTRSAAPRPRRVWHADAMRDCPSPGGEQTCLVNVSSLRGRVLRTLIKCSQGRDHFSFAQRANPVGSANHPAAAGRGPSDVRDIAKSVADTESRRFLRLARAYLSRQSLAIGALFCFRGGHRFRVFRKTRANGSQATMDAVWFLRVTTTAAVPNQPMTEYCPL